MWETTTKNMIWLTTLSGYKINLNYIEFIDYQITSSEEKPPTWFVRAKSSSSKTHYILVQGLETSDDAVKYIEDLFKFINC